MVDGMELFRSLFKRSCHGTLHHLLGKHLDRHMTEFTDRNDIRDMDTLDRMEFLARGFIGKRLRYADLVA